MSTTNIEAVLAWAKNNAPERMDGQVADARSELAAIQKTATALVDWNNKGRPAFHLDAARGYDVLERIAKESNT